MKRVAAADAPVVAYPAEYVQRYRSEGLWGSRTIAQELHATATYHGDRPALVTADGVLNYAELDARTDVVAAEVHAMGLRAGSTALCQLANSEAAVLIWYGLIKAGLVPVTALPQHGAYEIRQLAEIAEPALHVVQADHKDGVLVGVAQDVAADQSSERLVMTVGDVDERPGTIRFESLGLSVSAAAAARQVAVIQSRIGPDALAVLQLSGGTTNVPKLIPRLHAEYWYNAHAFARSIHLDADGCVAHVLPLMHNAGVVCAMHAAHSVGAPLLLAPFDVHRFATLLEHVDVTHMWMPPPLAHALTDNPRLRAALGSLRQVTWTLGKLPPRVVAMFETDTCRIQQLYGQGEGMCIVTPWDAPVAVRHQSVGMPLSPADEVRLLAPGSDDLVSGEEPGELCVRGPYTIRGYFRGGPRNVDAFTHDGFYRTGDVAVARTIAGVTVYTVEDRLKDVVSRGGEKINALEVEGLLLHHPRVAQAAVVAMPDERLGERSCAFVVLEEPGDHITLDELVSVMRERGVATFKWPERVEIRERLAQTPVGKVDKVRLREEIRAALASEQHCAHPTVSKDQL